MPRKAKRGIPIITARKVVQLNPQIIEKAVKKSLLFCPYEEYQAIEELMEDYMDLIDLREAKAEGQGQPSVPLDDCDQGAKERLICLFVERGKLFRTYVYYPEGEQPSWQKLNYPCHSLLMLKNWICWRQSGMIFQGMRRHLNLRNGMRIF